MKQLCCLVKLQALAKPEKALLPASYEENASRYLTRSTCGKLQNTRKMQRHQQQLKCHRKGATNLQLGYIYGFIRDDGSDMLLLVSYTTLKLFNLAILLYKLPF